MTEIGYKKPPKHDPAWYDPLAPADRRILYYLTDLADERGTRTVEAYAADMAKHAGVSRRQVFSSLRRLKDRNYIVSEQIVNARGGILGARYTILNPDRDRRAKVEQIAASSGLPFHLAVEYTYWLHFNRKKLEKVVYPTVGDVSVLAHCPAEDAEAFVKAAIAAGVLRDREVVF
jgi:hypothetical protein